MNKNIKKLNKATLYKYPEFEYEPVGEAILLQKLGDGLPFILEEDETYKLEKGEVLLLDTLEILQTTIRVQIDKIRVTSGYRREETKSYENYLVDRFLTVGGVEIF